MKFSIVIPCYNEKKNISELLSQMQLIQKQYNVEYILVENGSTDGSREYFRKSIEERYKNIKVVYVAKNQGYGYGIQQGLRIASGEYVGWMHADMQIPLDACVPFFNYIIRRQEHERMFLKGRRMNRRSLDKVFTIGQAIFNSILFRKKLYDIGAVPVLFHCSLSKDLDSMPNDFSIELYVYVKAVEDGFTIRRAKIQMLERRNGSSSWNSGWKSKIRQSMRILEDSILIRKGKKVL